jgi:flagellar hook-associated protein 1
MGLQTALSAARSSLLVNAAQTAVVSRNIAGASESGYSRRILLVESSGTGVRAGAVERATDDALRAAMLSATSEASASFAIANALSELQNIVGDAPNAQSPAALMGALQTSLTTAAASPQDSSILAGAVGAAKSLAASLNAASVQTGDVRVRADVGMAAGVDKINALLAQFGVTNATIVAGRQTGADVSDALDRRDALLSDLAGQIGITTVATRDGGMALYTDTGATLFQGSPRDVRMTSTTGFSAGMFGASVTVDGVAVAGPAATSATRSGAIAGYARIRDVDAPAYQNQLDEMARGLISAFAQQDQSGSGASARTGLYAWSGGPALPSGPTAGLAGQIQVDPSVDPAAGGDAKLLRDGGIDTGAGAYVYNATGSSNYSARLSELADALGLQQTFDTRARLGASASVIDFATASVGWLEAARKDAIDFSTQSDAVVAQAKSALSNATGVSIDDQMTQMLDLENTYQASAKMIATVDSMYSALFNAINR